MLSRAIIRAGSRRLPAVRLFCQAADSSSHTWDVNQYTRFEEERSQPFFDLMNRCQPWMLRRKEASDDEDPTSLQVLDLGCGTGTLTSIFYQMTQTLIPGGLQGLNVCTLGTDLSEDMLEQCVPLQADHRNLRFAQADLSDITQPGMLIADNPDNATQTLPLFSEEPADEIPQFDLSSAAQSFDIIISNACFHWLPNHDVLLNNLYRMLRPGGLLSFQLPSNHSHEAYRIASDLANEEPYASILREADVPETIIQSSLEPEQYAQYLSFIGFTPNSIETRTHVYNHFIPNRTEAQEWTKGAFLTPVLSTLPAELTSQYLAEYQSRLESWSQADSEQWRSWGEAMGCDKARNDQPDSEFHFTFRRTFVVAEKPTDEEAED